MHSLADHEPVIGLEVHCQLLTASKIFCTCPARFGAEPNSQICPVCLGHPGTLPVLNAHAVALAVRFALAVGAEVNRESVFARKNYVYPDLPKGYQISQYELPLAAGGTIVAKMDDEQVAVRIQRIHLEEDAGKLVHAAGGEDVTLVDFNRAGVPLIEVVTEPDLTSPRAAHRCLEHLRRLVRWLGVSDGNMDEGSLRCDANVSLRRRGAPHLGVKTEIKNLNSFRHVERSLAHEIERQAALLGRGERIEPETRLWDADRGCTVPLRSKEEAHDYRYFPDPDLPPLRLAPEWVARLAAEVPELPAARAERYEQVLGVSPAAAQLLTETREIGDYFERAGGRHGDMKRAANWIMTEVLGVLNDRGIGIGAFPVAPEALAELLDLIADGTLSGTLAKQVFAEMVATGRGAPDIVLTADLAQITDEALIRAEVSAVLALNPAAGGEAVAGKQKVIRFLMGELMKRTQGRVHPGRAGAALRAEIESRRRAGADARGGVDPRSAGSENETTR